MKKKIIVSLLLCCVLLIGTVGFAADGSQFALGAVLGEDEKTVTLSVNVEDYATVCGLSFNIVYDNRVLKFVKEERKAPMNGMSVLANGEYAEDTVRVVSAGATEMKQGGNVIDLIFEVIDPSADNASFRATEITRINKEGKKTPVTDVLTDASVALVPTQAPSPSPSADPTASPSVDPTAPPSASPTPSRHSSSSGSPSTPTTTQTPAATSSPSVQPEATTETAVSGLPFVDVHSDDWFYSYVSRAYEQKLMMGVSDNEFGPETEVTRAMFITVIYRLENQPPAVSSPFTDVEAGSWYEQAVAWGYANNIVSGTSETEFSPEENITREQMAAILYRYAKFIGLDLSAETNILSYEDYADISEYAISALQWTVDKNIMTGKTDFTLCPQDPATRAETATILVRFIDAF